MPRILLVLLLSTRVFAATPGLDVRFRAEEARSTRSGVIVELRRSASPRESLAQFRRELASLRRNTDGVAMAADPVRHVYVHTLLGAALDLSPEEARALSALPSVRAIHRDTTMTIHAGTPNAATTAAVIDAATRVNAQSLGTRGDGIVVGVLDTGIDYTHPALGGAFGNGHRVAGGWDFYNDDDDPRDDNGHGTHVAGIIGADSPELAGVAPGVTLIAYKVLGANGSGSLSAAIAAVERSIDPNQDGNPADHLDVINLSFGAPGTANDLMSQAVDKATAAGVVVVTSAGNAGLPASIGSPGTARTAITVGAIDFMGNVAAFSSRGPSPAVLELKPDVMAEGVAIPSAGFGGSVVLMSGTSMSAPHVAGVAALLKKLHPDWTPSQIRSAIVTTAVRNGSNPAVRGAGRIDAARAASANTFITGSGVSFGLSSATSGTWSATRTITVTNPGAAQTLTVGATNLPAGLTFAATPATLQLAAGASQNVDVTMTADASALAFPADAILGGEIELRGTATYTLPWLVMRGARTAIAYDGLVANMFTVSPDALQVLHVYDLNKAEHFGRPGSQHHFVAGGVAYDGGRTPSALHLVVNENRTISGDQLLALTPAHATAEVTFASRDAEGASIADAARTLVMGAHALSLRYRVDEGATHVAGAYHFDRIPRVFVTPVSDRFTFYPFEVLVDYERMRLYNLQHPPVAGIPESKTLAVTRDSYAHARFTFPPSPRNLYTMTACTANDLISRGRAWPEASLCFSRGFDAPPSFDYYTTMESGDAISGIDFDGSYVGITKLRGIGGAIVPVGLMTASPVTYRIKDGEHVQLGVTPLFPFAYFGTSPPLYLGSPSGLAGGNSELYPQAMSATMWTHFNAAGVQKGSGRMNGTSPEPQLAPGDRFVAVHDAVRPGGRPTRGELETRFGNNPGDLIAPTLTSFQLLDGNGKLAARLDRNAAATLTFSAADFDPSGTTLDLSAGATRVFYRLTGTQQWQQVNVTIEGKDEGTTAALGHVPAGELYRADLSAATQIAGAIDVRVEMSDTSGNYTSWTVSPAFVVEGETGGRRRRSVR